MDAQRQKWVNLSFVGISALLSTIVFVVAYKVVGIYDLEARIPQIELIVRIGSVALGALCFLILYRHGQVNQFTNEVLVELSRVTWPTQKDTSRATIVVVIMVLIAGLVLGAFDVFWIWVINQVL